MHEEEKKYSKAEVKIKDYNYPYIYLTEDEIEDFNSVCLQSDFGFKATPFTEYFKLTSPSKYMNNEDESIDEMVENNLGIDYSYVLIISVPIIILYEVLDYFQRKKIQKSDKIFVNIVRYLLPVITAVLFFVCTIVFYFLWNDFQILSITI